MNTSLNRNNNLPIDAEQAKFAQRVHILMGDIKGRTAFPQHSLFNNRLGPDWESHFCATVLWMFKGTSYFERVSSIVFQTFELYFCNKLPAHELAPSLINLFLKLGRMDVAQRANSLVPIGMQDVAFRLKNNLSTYKLDAMKQRKEDQQVVSVSSDVSANLILGSRNASQNNVNRNILNTSAPIINSISLNLESKNAINTEEAKVPHGTLVEDTRKRVKEILERSREATTKQVWSTARYREGRWSQEEKFYAVCLIDCFHKGLIFGLKKGTRLRSFLSYALRCTPMRISKKFINELSKGVYEPQIDEYSKSLALALYIVLEQLRSQVLRKIQTSCKQKDKSCLVCG